MTPLLPQTARGVALAALEAASSGRPPEDALEDLAGRLDRRDRALALALTFGVLRWQNRLDYMMTPFLSRPGKKMPAAVRRILRLGLYQIWKMDRIPTSAAVNEAVKLAKTSGPKWAAGLVNAVLRAAVRAERLPDPAEADLPPLERLALTHAHPLWLVERWAAELGVEEAEALLAANNARPPLTVRVNTGKIDREILLSRFQENGLTAQKAPYADQAIQLTDPSGPIPELPGFEDGLFSVQDQAAQLIGRLAMPRSAGLILDGCAGLGAKSMHLLEGGAGAVVGLDLDRRRLFKAPLEARRLGLNGFRPAVGDLTRPPLTDNAFDVVLVDAPCSNLGVIRRRPDVKWSKSESDIKRLAELQADLLFKAADLVKPGGRLVYAVCTHTPEETQGVIDRFWMNHLEFGLFPASSFLPAAARPLCADDGTLRAWPHRHDADGFFAAVLERKVAKPVFPR